MASEVEIANRALQRVGATRITSLTEGTVNAREVLAMFASVRDAELRSHRWSFAIKRASLASSGTAPAFGPANAFPLPSDFLKLIPPDEQFHYNDLDWQIEGSSIVSNAAAPLQIRYVAQITDPNLMDALFREAFAMRLARELCEPLTQSNTKIQLIQVDYDRSIADAKKANAIERTPVLPPDDTWVTVRI